MLTGKCKTDFEEWYNHEYYNSVYSITFSLTQTQYERGSERPMDVTIDISFYELPETMQQGVYLAFFREKGIEVDIQYNEEAGGDCFYQVKVYLRKDYWTGDRLIEELDYNTALTEAIKQANQIYNKEK